ncbi:hypothetical protein Ga0466249_003848 [Sporomusaceae bacterium BoRhaA]|uniref:helix-turn-helix domain-containing protein n=1 Tax=Pelorhabdus rhamnosifermentans TaxID=2772457 RepID=UPI001C05F1A3|nr:helix-turn-helix domain-containing protein [Pelorhabdus rhamnosifermentans]MBU2702713.1 hypothetical protein [Pelorhabdus rhamnosifermentans]
MDGYYNVRQAAEAMNVSIKTVRNRIKAGELPATWEDRGKGRSQWWIPIAAIQAAATAVDAVPFTRQPTLTAELGQLVQSAVQTAVKDVVKDEIQQLRAELDSHFRRQDERIREVLVKPQQARGFWHKLFK